MKQLTYFLIACLVIIFYPFFLHAQNPGNLLFDDSYIHEIRITFYPEDRDSYWRKLEDNYQKYLDDETRLNKKKYLLASVVIDGNSIDSVGFREKGLKSNYGIRKTDSAIKPPAKVPFKIDLAEFAKRKYDGLKKINLQNGFSDPSFMRDKLSYNILREAGLKAPRSAYAKLYLNNKYWGLYLMVEQIDKTFLKQNFSSKKGNLYKCIWNTNLKWLGSEVTNYESHEMFKRTNKTKNNWSDFIHFIDIINNTPVAQVEDSVDAVFEIDDFLKSMAIDVLTANWDSYFDNGRNFYIYNNPDNNKFSWIHWDYNTAFSSKEMGMFRHRDAPPGRGGAKPLENCVYFNPNFRTEYLFKYLDILSNNFNTERLTQLINHFTTIISPVIPHETHPLFDNITTAFQNGTTSLKMYISNRATRMNTKTNNLLEKERDKNLMINEIMISNTQTIADEANQYDSWIELYNPTETAISLKSFYLSVNTLAPKKWNLPDISIPAKEYKILWIDNAPRQGELHSNFGIDNNTKRVLLLQQKSPSDRLRLINSVKLPTAIPKEKTFGRKQTTEILHWGILENPTPGNLNSNVSSAINNLSGNEEFKLGQNYPNPFKSSTNIEFFIAQDSPVEISIYNLQGKKITTLIDEFFSAGNHKITVNTNGLKSNIYLYKIVAGKFSNVKQMVVIK
jgi:spore coat protein CotH